MGSPVSVLLVLLSTISTNAFLAPPLATLRPSVALAMSTASPMEQFRQQQELARRDMMEERSRRDYETDLEGIESGNAPARLLDRAFWMQFAKGGLSIADDPYSATVAAFRRDAFTARFTDGAAQSKYFSDRGFCKVDAPSLDWQSIGVDMNSLSETMGALQAAGIPPVYVLMFDEGWRLIEGLFDVLGPVLGDLDLELENSVYGWALEIPELDGAKKEKVGGNFGVPHRDQCFDSSHLEDGKPSVISVWVPVTDATLDNGCMYVIPREHDPLFEKTEDRVHLAPHTERFPFQFSRALPAAQGSVLAWHPNTIHWGSGCTTYAHEPRKSIAMSFRVPQSRQALTEKELKAQRRLPYKRSEISAGLSLEERLILCSRGVFLYSVWHPLFDGMDRAFAKKE